MSPPETSASGACASVEGQACGGSQEWNLLWPPGACQPLRGEVGQREAQANNNTWQEL